MPLSFRNRRRLVRLQRLIGMITRSHILAAYERALTSGH
jgi:hypothetical protein